MSGKIGITCTLQDSVKKELYFKAIDVLETTYNSVKLNYDVEINLDKKRWASTSDSWTDDVQDNNGMFNRYRTKIYCSMYGSQEIDENFDYFNGNYGENYTILSPIDYNQETKEYKISSEGHGGVLYRTHAENIDTNIEIDYPGAWTAEITLAGDQPFQFSLCGVNLKTDKDAVITFKSDVVIDNLEIRLMGGKENKLIGKKYGILFDLPKGSTVRLFTYTDTSTLITSGGECGINFGDSDVTFESGNYFGSVQSRGKIENTGARVVGELELTAEVNGELYNDITVDKTNRTVTINNLNPETDYDINLIASFEPYIAISNTVKVRTGEVPFVTYGVRIMTNNSNPETAITYIEEAVGTTPAKNGNLNGWKDKWPFNKIRIVGFKNGQVTKEINPMNKTKYIDGSNVPTDVDVMSEIPKVYWKVNTITDGYEIRISDKQVDSNYKCLAHLVGEEEKDFIYIGAYLGYVENGKLRSKSGVSPTADTTLTQFRKYAQAVGYGYQLDNWYPLVLRKILYLIAYKNLDSQTALGKGNTKSSKKDTGGTNTRGLYYGSTSAAEQVCFLGIEDFYGNLYTWVDGMYYNGNIMVTPDNKTFNDSASGYKNVGSTPNLSTYGYVKNVVKTAEGLFFPSDLGGNTNTYYSDYGVVLLGYFSIHGGQCGEGASAGTFYLDVHFSPSNSYPAIGGRLVYMG